MFETNYNKINMLKNKAKPTQSNPQKQLKTPIQQQQLSKQRKIQILLDGLNQAIYQSLQTGDTRIPQPEKTSKILISNTNNFIFQQILSGLFQINQNQIPYNLSKKNRQNYDQIKQNFFDSNNPPSSVNLIQIQNINKTLKQLHQNLQRQKSIEKNQSQKLKHKAKSFIMKLQKQKIQFKEKIKNKKSEGRVFLRAYSEETIRKMQDKLAEKFKQKRIKLEERLQSIQKKKVSRIEDSVNNQIQYWQKVKKYQSCKNLQRKNTSDSLFPAIDNHQKNIIKINKESAKRKYSSKLQHGIQRQSVFQTKFQAIDRYVMKAKLRLELFQNKQKQSKEKVDSNGGYPEKNEFENLYVSNQSSSSKKLTNPELDEHRIKNSDFLKKSQEPSKLRQLVGNSYFKQSFDNKIKNRKKRQGELSTLLVSNSQINQNPSSLFIHANQIKPSKTLIQVQLQKVWKTSFEKMKWIQNHKIQNLLSELAQIQKRLDKYDKEGIISRFKLKAEALKNRQIQNLEVSEFNKRVKQDIQAQTNKPDTEIQKISNFPQKNKYKELDTSNNEFLCLQFKNKSKSKC